MAVMLNGFACKNPMQVQANDFFFSGLHLTGNMSNPVGSKVTPVTVAQLPGLNTLGISMVRIDYAPLGMNPPHTHPRATEILTVLEGSLEVGFVTSNPGNNLFAKVLQMGDVFVFPEGLVHFQRNVGHYNAVAIAALSSQNPGVITIGNAVFGSKPDIPADILSKAFQVDKNVLNVFIFTRSKTLRREACNHDSESGSLRDVTNELHIWPTKVNRTIKRIKRNRIPNTRSKVKKMRKCRRCQHLGFRNKKIYSETKAQIQHLGNEPFHRQDPQAGGNAFMLINTRLCSDRITWIVALAADQSPLQDFCVADPNSPVGSKVTPVTVAQLPGLNTLGISMVRIDYAPLGMNPPHTHPRATEILTVLEGSLEVGFVTSNPGNNLFTKVLQKGDVFVFPQGLVHFQRNVGHYSAVAIAALSSQNPGVITIGNAVFGSKPDIPTDILSKSFQVDKNVIYQLQANVALAADHSPLQDFCVADPNSPGNV
ncbi:hypothetical protein LguiA_014722 [Lonicera macranthoides]